MAKLPRKYLKVFGENATSGQIVKFGSRSAGSSTATTDPEEIQSLTAYEQGWKNALLITSKGTLAPSLNDMNSLHYLETYHLKYLTQEGIPEWLATETYYTGSVCKIGTTIYVSKVDNNINNNPVGDTTNWGDTLNFPTQAITDNSTKVATTEFVNNYSSNNLVNYGNVSEAILAMPTLTSYSGTTITAYSGIKFLLSDGLNADGSYKHKIYTTPSNLPCYANEWGLTMFGFIMWRMNLDGTGEMVRFVSGAAVYYSSNQPTGVEGRFWKDTKNNKWYLYTSGSWTQIYAYNLGWASIYYPTSSIATFQPKTVTDLKVNDNLYKFTSTDIGFMQYSYAYSPKLDITFDIVSKFLTINLKCGATVTNQAAVFRFPEIIKAPSTLTDIGGLGCGLYNYTTACPVELRVNTNNQVISSHFLNVSVNEYNLEFAGIADWEA